MNPRLWLAAVLILPVVLIPAAEPGFLPSDNLSRLPSPQSVSADAIELRTQQTTPPEAAVRGIVTGEVQNGTGGEVEAGLEIVLSAFDSSERVLWLTTQAGDDGSFSFGPVELDPELIYLVSAEFEGVLYSSMPAQPDPGQEILFIPLLVFESTSAVDALSISRLHLAFDFLEADAVRVGELWILNNNSGSTILPPAGLTIELPSGFRNLEVAPDMEPGITVTDSGFHLEQPFLPGEDAGSLMFSYSLPYKRSLELARTFSFPVEAGTVLLPANGPVIHAELITTRETLSIAQTSVQMYSLSRLPAGEELHMRISGSPPGASILLRSEPANLAAGILLLLLSAVLFWHAFRKHAGTAGIDDADDTFEDLVQKLVELDRVYAAGSLSQGVYRQRRAGLKARARQLYEESHDPG
jgi:hypothetical protein